jgi:asparagine synthase (glutamine-hydrolysing)
MVLGLHILGQTILDDPLPTALTSDAVGRMMAQDMRTYLPDDILCKVDRAAMAVSLETRAPFLDPGVLVVSARLPLHMKLRDGQGKWALRQILYRHVPRDLIERPKTGFGIPVGEWLRGPLRAWAEDLLSEDRLQREGLIDPVPVRQAWSEHLSGRSDWTHRLWIVLMLQAWMARFT